MPTSFSLNVAGTWKDIGPAGVYHRVGGVWRQVDFVYEKVAGVWTPGYQRDRTGPAAVTAQRATFTSGVFATRNLRTTWTSPADADYSYTQVVATSPSEGISQTFNVSGAPNSAHTHNWAGYSSYSVVLTIYLTPFDTAGNPGPTTTVNSMEWTGAARGMISDTVVMIPTGSANFEVDRGAGPDTAPTGASQWISATGDVTVPSQGFAADVAADPYYANNMGFYFYGDVFSYLRGTTISAASVYTTPNVTGSPSISYSPYTDMSVIPSSSNFHGTTLASSLTANTGQYISIPSGWFAAMADPTATFRFKSLVFWNNQGLTINFSPARSGAHSTTAGYLYLNTSG